MDFFEFSFGDGLYHISTTLFFGCIFLFISLKIQSAKKRSRRNLKQRDINDAVETESPISNQEKQLKQYGIDALETRFSFIETSLPILLGIAWFFVSIFPYLGKIPAVYISVVTAIASVVVGIALRPFLENMFSGVIISFFKSLKVGDTVIIDGHYGLIEQIGLTYSILKCWDWKRVVIPNTKLLQKEIQNLTMRDDFLWAHIDFFVAPGTDMDTVERLAKQAAKDSKYFSPVEDPTFWVVDLQKDSVKCWLAAWAESPSDSWELRSEIRSNLYRSLQKENISFHSFSIDSKSHPMMEA